MARDAAKSNEEVSLREELARRLMAAEVALRSAQAGLRASKGSNAARKRYADARAELQEAEAFAIRLAGVEPERGNR